MKLVHETTGKEVKIGDELTTFRGEKVILEGAEKPHTEASTGRIYVRVPGAKHQDAYYPSVCDLKWVPVKSQRRDK